jgi:acetyl-CoA carboxylase carboxyl transferase subunit beta
MENSMSIREWFEDRRKITGLLKNLVERDSKDVNEIERNKNLSIDYIKINRLWVQCDNCESFLYIRFLREDKSVCEECGYYLQMNSSDRIELPIDRDTWHPMDEDMYTLDVLQFHF